MTRFARNTVTTIETVRELRLLGIDIFFEKENIHSIDASGGLMLTILASFAQEESLSASENCKWRVRKMFEVRQSTPVRMLGYKWIKGKLEVLPEEARTVRRIYRLYLSGMGSLYCPKANNRVSTRAKER